MNGSCVTLRALKPYLVLYRILGLIPLQPEKKSDELLLKQWNWKRLGFKLYSAILLLSLITFLVEHLLSLLKPSSDGIVAKLDSTNIASFSLNILVILIICFSYLGKRVCCLIEGMIRSEKEMIAIGCSLQTDGDKNGNLVVYCWTVLFAGVVATVINELAYLLCNDHNHLFHNENNGTSGNSSASSFKITSIGCFRMIMTPFAAGIWPFIDYSIIQFSLVLSYYQHSLRKRIEQWACFNLNEKERIRLTYWTVQSLIKEADQVFSPAVLIGSLSCVTHLIVQINIGLRNNIFRSLSEEDFNIVIVATASTLYMALRFAASSFFADRIYSEKMKSLQCLLQQSKDEFWTNDLELLITKRFVQQLAMPIGFTGCGFFTLGKRYFITICGTILTYEVVLLDMVGSNIPESQRPSNHSTPDL